MNSQDIIEIALVIRGELPRLLGEDYHVKIQELDALLREVKNSSEEEVEDKILDILVSEEIVKNRINELFPNVSKGVKSVFLAGDGSAIPANKFKCPIPDCNYTWSRYDNSLAIPTCKKHPTEILVHL
jgi:hypothetical protein